MCLSKIPTLVTKNELGYNENLLNYEFYPQFLLLT